MLIAANEVLKTLADPTCRAIFEPLSLDGEQTARALTDRAPFGVTGSIASKPC